MARSLSRPPRPSLLPLTALLILTLSAPAYAAESRVCAFLGDRLGGRRDVDQLTFTAARAERIEVVLEERDDPRNRGSRARQATSLRGR